MADQFGDVEPAGQNAAIVRIAEIIARLGIATDGLRVRLSEANGQAVAQANARAERRAFRVQVAAATVGEAADDLADRIGHRILEAVACWSPRKWPDGGDASVRSRVPSGERVVGPWLLARVKAVQLATCPPEVAVAVMDLMDYSAHLFIDTDTGADAVVYRGGPTGYRLARLHAAPPPTPNAVPLTVEPRPPAPLSIERAIARLEETGMGHLFFADTDTGRGQLLYRRFDDRYGLVKDTR